MGPHIIDGKKIAKEVRAEVKAEVDRLVASGMRHPSLAVVMVGRDPASQIYVNNKRKACRKIGINSVEHLLDETITEKTLLGIIDKLNNDDNIDGILIQLPLPGKLHEKRILERLNPDKDVDGFHPVNVGRLTVDSPGLRPCTPAGIIEMLKRSDVKLTGKNAVVLGRSNIVGKPVATMLLHESATVTICHSKTRGLKEITKRADVLIAAIGKPKFVTQDMVKEGAVVIDVGINRTDEGLVGDVDYENVEKLASRISPVPGGVGPMTIAMLMHNTLKAYKIHEGVK
jgi:methylenetetrahydrofolate dehydrogenase (NADP+)/methenyltetrahydrofolate cyclohydrolase